MEYNRKDIARAALESALKAGCSSARITYNINTQSSYSVRNDKLDRLHQAKGSSLYIQLFTEGRYGAYSTNRLNKEELKEFITNAAEVTRLLAPDNCRVLPSPGLYYKGNGSDLGQYDNTISNIHPKEKIDLAFGCAGEIYKKEAGIVSVNCEYGDSDDYVYILDSQGFEGENSQTLFSLSAECSVKGRGDARPEGWWYESALSFDKLVKEGVGRRAFERAHSRLNPRKMKSGKYNIVLENTVSTRVVAPIISALNGSAIQQNNSFLKDKLGSRVFTSPFSIVDNPHMQGEYGSRYFDSEGVATKPMNIIEEGVINTYFINSYNSLKLNMPVTIEGPSVPMCVWGDGNRSTNLKQVVLQEDILKSAVRGILVTGFNGGNTNTSTGDFSFGIQGFFFENGQLQHPINEMNITGNIIQLWNNIIAIGTDPRKTGRWLIPTLAFESVNFSGI